MSWQLRIESPTHLNVTTSSRPMLFLVKSRTPFLSWSSRRIPQSESHSIRQAQASKYSPSSTQLNTLPLDSFVKDFGKNRCFSAG